jgi:hypothetical protein
MDNIQQNVAESEYRQWMGNMSSPRMDNVQQNAAEFEYR